MHTLEAVRKYEKEYEVDADKRPLFHEHHRSAG